MDQRRVEDLLGKNAQLELENQSLQEQVSLLSLQLEEERGRITGKHQEKLIKVYQMICLHFTIKDLNPSMSVWGIYALKCTVDISS